MATYVLIHGAYQGGWIWQRVAARLRAAGHAVHAPTLDGCAERHHLVRPRITAGTHAREVAQLLFYEDLRQVVLVATSAGGMVACLAAVRRAIASRGSSSSTPSRSCRARRSRRSSRCRPTRARPPPRSPRAPTPRSASSPISTPTPVPGR